jgi:uncharacterized membrane protein YkoI
MILTGHIKGGDDNIVMISVTDDTVDSELLNKVNSAIKAFLENKQIEATILNQAIAKGESKIENSSGKAVVAEKISTLGSDLSLDELSNMSLKQLIKYSKENNIDTRHLFMVVTGNLDKTIEFEKEDDDDRASKPANNNTSKIPAKKGKISDDEAKKIALDLVNGTVIEFEEDDDEFEIEIVKDGIEYEIEIDSYSGKVLEFEKED